MFDFVKNRIIHHLENEHRREMFFLRRLFSHYKKLVNGFNNIVKLDGFTKEEFQSRLRNGNRRFWIATFLGIFVLTEAFYLVVKTKGVYDHYFYTITRIWPATSEQRNSISSGAYFAYLWIFSCETFETWPHLDAIFYFTDSGRKKNQIIFHDQIMSGIMPKKLLDYHHKKQRQFIISNSIIVFGVNFVWAGQFYIGEIFAPNESTGSLRNIIYYVITPFYVTYLTFVVIYPSYFWLNCRYIQIQQNHHIQWMKRAIDKIIRCKNPRKIKRLEETYNKRFEQIFIMLKSIRTVNTFWSKYMTSSLALYVLEVCYVFFAMITAKTWMEKIQLFPLFYFGFAYFVYLYTISANCSRIFQNNVILHR